MPNITIHLDDETHRLAKVYSAQSGESLSKLFRDHIRRVSSPPPGTSPRQAVLDRYSQLKVSAKDAMSALDMQCLEELLGEIVATGLPLPHEDTKVAVSMANRFLAAHKSEATGSHA